MPCALLRRAAPPAAPPRSHALLLPQEIRELIAKCWAADPEDRPPFDRIVDELEQVPAKLPRPQLTAGAGGCCTVA